MDILSFSTVAGNVKKEISNRCGLNLSQTRILLYFDQNNNMALKMGDLATNLQISLSTLSRQLQQKKTLGFVTITRSENDSSKTVVLNENGQQKIIELKRALTQIEKSMFKNFSQQDLAVFTKIFSTLVEQAQANSLN